MIGLEITGCKWRYALIVVQARNDDDWWSEWKIRAGGTALSDLNPISYLQLND